MAQTARAAMRSGGEIIYLGYVNMHMVTHLFANGAPLREVFEEGSSGRTQAARANLPYVVADIDHQLTLVRMLRGQTPTFGTLDVGDFRERDFEDSIDKRLPHLRARYWIRKLLARYFVEDYREAVAAAEAVGRRRPERPRGAAFPAVLLDEARRHGGGPLDQPVDRDGPRRCAVAHPQRRSRSDVLFRPADAHGSGVTPRRDVAHQASSRATVPTPPSAQMLTSARAPFSIAASSLIA